MMKQEKEEKKNTYIHLLMKNIYGYPYHAWKEILILPTRV